jgi:hypothetical protein
MRSKTTEHKQKQSPMVPPLQPQGRQPGPPVIPPVSSQRADWGKGHHWLMIIAVFALFVLLLSTGVLVFVQGGSGLNRQPSPGSKGVPSTSQIMNPSAVTNQPAETSSSLVAPESGANAATAPGVILGPQQCPAGIGDAARWNTHIGTNHGERSVEQVSCAHLTGTSTLQSLVTVRHKGSNRLLDVFVFDQISSTSPRQLFKLSGLIKGEAKISGYNTILTAQVDTNSRANAGKSASTMMADVFREFDWSATIGTLVQVAFPGLYPDLTGYQAEADQIRINGGQDRWKNDPQQVAKAMVRQFFQWQRPLTSWLTSGGGARDVCATVRVQETPWKGAQGQGPLPS